MKGERTIVPGSWRLGGDRDPWPTAEATRVTIGTSLTLAPTPDGPRSLRSPEGTLGGLVLPPTLAVDAGVVWLVDREAATLRRFDPVSGRFVLLPGWGAASSGTQRFGPRTSLAATCWLLALADADSGRVVVAGTSPLLVRAVFELPDGRPVAVAGHAGRFHVLDDRGRLWATTSTLDRLAPEVAPGRLPEGTWRRLVVDSTGRPWRVDAVSGRLLSAADGAWELLSGADALRPRCPAPALQVDRAGRFRVPAAHRLADSDPDPWFGPGGEPCSIPPGEYAGNAPYAAEGCWTSRPLDSGVLGCRWHHVVVTGVHPPGCTTTVETYTSDDRRDPADVPPDAWSPVHRVGPDDHSESGVDHAVLSPRGRHLVLRIGLHGDGWATPSVDSLLVEPEAAGIDRFLPAVYRSNDQDADFLRRFLAMFGTELDGVEQSLRSLPARFSPSAVPDSALDVLAAELGVPLERGWSAEQRRTMLVTTPRWHRRRGTPAALAALLRTHLEAATGRELPEPVPVLVEGFRQRESALVGRTRLPMGAGERTWSDDVVGRPVLGSRHAERIQLVSLGDRLTDRFRVHAHRFTVVVPRPLLPGRDARERFERLVSAEKPAHVAHELLLVEPRVVVGAQGLVGVDTFVGAWPEARLAPTGCRGSSLGLGLRLGRRGPVAPPAVGRGGRVGVGAVVA
ncbi:MAG: phage tail protein [Nocardioides sp.]